jgi:hypothetical protein
MTVLRALAVLESATMECKKRDINTPEVMEALALLEPHIQPAWLIPQFRHHVGGERENGYQREGQQQVLRPTFEGIRDSVRELIGKQMDALARKFAATHDTNVKAEIDRLSSELVKLDRRGCSWRGEEFRASDPFVYSSMVSFNV